MGRAVPRFPPSARNRVPKSRLRIDAVRIVIRIHEISEADAGLAVRREPHHFPLVAIRSEAQILRELRVKQAERIGPGNRKDVLEAATASVPQRRGFPGAAAVDHQNGCVVESREGVSADGVREMMIHETKPRARGTEIAQKRFLAALLVPDAGEIARGIDEIEKSGTRATFREAFQIVTEKSAPLLPAKADKIEIGGVYTGEVETRPDRADRKAGVVLGAAQSFFGDGEERLAIAHDARRGVVHLRVVDPKRNHRPSPAPRSPQHQAIGVFSPEKCRDCPPADSRIKRTAAESREIPCQLFPTISGSRRIAEAVARAAR